MNRPTSLRGPLDEPLDQDLRIEIYALVGSSSETWEPASLSDAHTFAVVRVSENPEGRLSIEWLDAAPSLGEARTTAFLHGAPTAPLIQVPVDGPPPLGARLVGYTVLPLTDGRPGPVDEANDVLVRPVLCDPETDLMYRGDPVAPEAVLDDEASTWLDCDTEESPPYFPVSPALVDGLLRATAGDDGIDPGERAAAIGGISTVARNQTRTLSAAPRSTTSRPGQAAARELRVGARDLRATAARLDALAADLEANGTPDGVSDTTAYAMRHYDDAQRRYRGTEPSPQRQ